VIKAMQSKPNLKKFYKKEVENNKEQLPTWLQPNKHPRQGILPQILSEMPDEKLRFFHLPYAFFCDLLAMHAVDSHALIYRHPKWNEWYYNVWKDFYLKMSPEYEPEQVLSIKRATIPTISLPSQLIPALADVVKIVTLDNRLVEPEKFRKGEGFRIIQNEIVPILLNSTSSFVSDADAKNVLRDIVEGQKVKLKSLMDNMGLLENSPESKVSTVLKTLLPEELLEVMGLVCPIAGLLDIAKTSYFRWLHWKDSRKIRELRTAAKKNGVWFGLMVNEEGLLKYRDLWKMIP
jgi:hypothetical protein